ncbi:Membrane protein implicated in regulation of membrane protease activity [Jatrophihabitans endophyticus]|uniref:Membrane protein implicated in regulation of membrane protease activity n=1 Tax=Jatrophihabitans endophyticus TaxID=1206085 RepID=A0A1M5N9Z9_9ACTN|nr:NfeD family protein [Jatrophihabitans endophyticus]SHG86029.1 Membrane protein implicated in regulation of membrane protease activity [Jatrophihabitans endophyticus]
MPAWLVWLIAAGVLAVAETLSVDFVLIMLAAGAGAGAITAALGGPLALQIVVALVVTGIGVGALRPVAKRHLTPGESATGTDALVGMPALTLDPVDPHSGRVRLNGAEWTARPFDDRPIPAGAAVRVVRISGATALVIAEEDTAAGELPAAGTL